MSSTGPAKKLLLIDDDDKVLLIVGAFLRQRGFQVYCEADGLAGVARAREVQPDLVVCDLDMPRMDGFAVLEALRAEPTLAGLPLIFLTAHSSRPFQRRSMNLGADDFLGKPVDFADLEAAIRTRMHRRDEERARVERRVDEATQAFASIVHDLRDPLCAIVGNTDLLEAREGSPYAGDEQSVRLFERLREAASRMEGILSEVMFLARSRTGRLPFDPGPLDLLELVRRLIEEHEAKERLVLSAGEGSYAVTADAVRVRQALRNVVANALKYSDATVEIRLSSSPGGCSVEVEDHGIGIPPGEQAGLFEPFSRASNATGVPGNGLGLCVAARCVEQHGGSLQARSAPGAGSTFTVFLPRSSERAERGAPAGRGRVAAAGSGVAGRARRSSALSCVVVDDDPLVRGLLRDLLEESGEVVVKGEAGSVAEGRTLLERVSPDAAFLDIGLPDGTGFDLLPKLKTGTSVVFVSGAEEHAADAFDCDAADYVLKPVTRERLRRTLERLRGRGRAGAPQPAGDRQGLSDAFLVKTLKGAQKVLVQEVRTIAACGEYSWVYWGPREGALMRKPVKQWESELPARQFVRVHRNAIVNLSFLERVERLAGGKLQLRVADTAEPIPVSVRMMGSFNRKLREFGSRKGEAR